MQTTKYLLLSLVIGIVIAWPRLLLAGNAGNPRPVQTQGTLKFGDKRYEFVSEYWDEPCLVVNNRNDFPGMHQAFISILRRR